jgi:hypothetical protein
VSSSTFHTVVHDSYFCRCRVVAEPVFGGILFTLFAQRPGFFQGLNILADPLLPCGGMLCLHCYITLFKNNMKKIPKYIFYAVGAAAILLVLYILFQSTRETFTSVNPIPSEAEMIALEATFIKAREDANKNNIKYPQLGTNVLQAAPQSVKAVAKFLKANVIPLLPYRMAKNAQTPDGDNTDFYIVLFMIHLTKPLIAPLAYAVRQQSAAPTLPAFVDMAINVLKENANAPPDWPDPRTKELIDQAKKGETTLEVPNMGTIPNAAYWGYKYIYGEPKATKTGSPAKGSSGSPTLGSSKCVPSIYGVPGGMTETRCFNT